MREARHREAQLSLQGTILSSSRELEREPCRTCPVIIRPHLHYQLRSRLPASGTSQPVLSIRISEWLRSQGPRGQSCTVYQVFPQSLQVRWDLMPKQKHKRGAYDTYGGRMLLFMRSVTEAYGRWPHHTGLSRQSSPRINGLADTHQDRRVEAPTTDAAVSDSLVARQACRANFSSQCRGQRRFDSHIFDWNE
ncbi:hypothetical protein BC629DRAFT_1071205 [Irpex lacteus]|nr:hypothetical protein BC629DRAFT_1071205 [Irpex lacteus]